MRARHLIVYFCGMAETKFDIVKWFAHRGNPLIVAGPCSVESREQIIGTATALAATGKAHVLRGGIWKPRTQPSAFEGIGERGLPWLCEAGRLSGLPTATEVATPHHVELCLENGIDMVWIGARTVGNPFSVHELSESLRGTDLAVFIKNPIAPDLNLWVGAFERMKKCGIAHVAGIHRGFHTLPETDFRNTPLWDMAIEFSRITGAPTLTDISHICGRRDTLKATAQKALDLATDGLMIESHTDPSKALTDPQQQIEPHAFGQLMDSLVFRHLNTTDSAFDLKVLRAEIDSIDEAIIQNLAKRMKVSEQIGEYKRTNNIAVVQLNRWKQLLSDHMDKGSTLGLDPDFVAAFFDLIHKESIKRQTDILEQDGDE